MTAARTKGNAMKIRTDRKNNAAEAYSRKHADIQEKLERLVEALRDHSDRQSESPDDWGFVGSLGHVAATLDEMLSFVESRPVRR